LLDGVCSLHFTHFQRSYLDKFSFFTKSFKQSYNELDCFEIGIVRYLNDSNLVNTVSQFLQVSVDLI